MMGRPGGGGRVGRKGGRRARGEAIAPNTPLCLLWSQGGVSNVLPYRPPSPPACSCARRAQRLFISGSGFRKNPKTCQRKSRKQKKLSPPLAVRVRPCPSVWLFTSVPGFRFQVSGKTPAAPSTGLAPVCLRLRLAPSPPTPPPCHPFGALRSPLLPPHGRNKAPYRPCGSVPAVRRTWCRGFRLHFAGVPRKNNRRIFR